MLRLAACAQLLPQCASKSRYLFHPAHHEIYLNQSEWKLNLQSAVASEIGVQLPALTVPHPGRSGPDPHSFIFVRVRATPDSLQ